MKEMGDGFADESVAPKSSRTNSTSSAAHIDNSPNIDCCDTKSVSLSEMTTRKRMTLPGNQRYLTSSRRRFDLILACSGGPKTSESFAGQFLQVDYLSSTGRHLTFSKLVGLMFLPIVGAWAFTIYSLVDNVVARDETKEAQETMLKSIYIGRLIYRIQKERDMTLLYISSIGPGTKTFLIREYDSTDQTFAEILTWPDEFAIHPQKEFRSKKMLTSHINQFRTQLDGTLTTTKDALDFYTNIVDFFIEWMVDNIRESGFGNIWKSLVAFHKITRCMLDTGAERAYGTMFFGQGNFPEDWFYDLYFRRIHRFNYSYKSATYYSDLVDPLRHERSDQRNLTLFIRSFRNIIKFSNFSASYQSAEIAQSYFDNITFRVDYLYSLQEEIADRVIGRINEHVDSMTIEIILYAVTVTIVILAYPLIAYFSDVLTSYVQTYAKALAETSDDLNSERRRTDSLLHQMLPKMVIKNLKNGSKVESQFFKSATVLFSGIVNFTQMSIEYTPMELMGLLNMLYTSIDAKIESYDVYKVETINDTYMVVSGVPKPNGVTHATEIANFALEINTLIRKMAYSSKITIPTQLQMGASSGSISAGIVGSTTLRYCLFGDTVNIASRMKSYSSASRIHISESLFKILDKTRSYKLHPRGTLEVKGKGPMKTYWLLDCNKTSDGSVMQQSNFQLLGESGMRDSPEMYDNEVDIVQTMKDTYGFDASSVV